MKVAVIYYSCEGNCVLVADNMKTVFNADTFRIMTMDAKKRYGAGLMIWGCLQVFMKKKPALAPLPVDINAYDLIILGTPVWAGSPAPAMVSFLENAKISGKKIALFCCHGGGPGAIFAKLRDLLQGNTIVGEISFKYPAKNESTDLKQRIKEWAKTFSA